MEELLEKEARIQSQLKAIEKEITEFSDGYWYYIQCFKDVYFKYEEILTNYVAAARHLSYIIFEYYDNDCDSYGFKPIIITNNPEFNYISSMDALKIYLRKMTLIHLECFSEGEWNDTMQAELDSLNDIEMVKMKK